MTEIEDHHQIARWVSDLQSPAYPVVIDCVLLGSKSSIAMRAWLFAWFRLAASTPSSSVILPVLLTK